MAAPHLTRTEAVVLYRHDLGETDRIVTLYTSQHGKVRAIAKGIRRPTSKLGGHLELFTHSLIMLAKGRTFDVITQAETVSSFLGLREDLLRTGLAYVVAELVDRLTEDRSENFPLFKLLVLTLDRVASAKYPAQAARLFAVQALDILGYRPELSRCVHCLKPLPPNGNRFSLINGGILCDNCRGIDPLARVLSTNAIKLLRLFRENNWPLTNRVHVDSELAEEIDQVVRRYCEVICESQIKSAGFVATLRHAAESKPVPT